MQINRSVSFTLVGIFLAMGACGKHLHIKTSRQKVIASARPAPKTCKYLGQIVGSKEATRETDDAQVLDDAKNDLKNKAADIGANYVHFLTYAPDPSWAGTSITSIRYLATGYAYACDPTLIGL